MMNPVSFSFKQSEACVWHVEVNDLLMSVVLCYQSEEPTEEACSTYVLKSSYSWG